MSDELKAFTDLELIDELYRRAGDQEFSIFCFCALMDRDNKGDKQ